MDLLPGNSSGRRPSGPSPPLPDMLIGVLSRKGNLELRLGRWRAMGDWALQHSGYAPGLAGRCRRDWDTACKKAANRGNLVGGRQLKGAGQGVAHPVGLLAVVFQNALGEQQV